ncbi:PPOX class F420-dependent oxidoreductase [Williamsia muralis]|uniref:PPOX class F420-dependent oxidoreductase n=1 Tax=Williamsia marianensis TaxID=85044 RepID=A0ABU4ENH7_WILMA|nr:PPOX class F420-dependent oxidoreductase [Williamsia muralis]MDV7132795.1 PPOX class F420-dependent oxidoreductase [Williamsia muralis]
MTTPFGQAGTAKYVQLTTFRKDGTPVSSPLWAALDGDKLLMWTVTDSWKVKRLRRNPAVVVQACDVRGKQTYGDPVSGTAQVLDTSGSDHARDVVQKKYGLLGWVTVKGSLLRRGKKGTVGLAITASS